MTSRTMSPLVFVLKGFSQQQETRLFTFENVDEKRVRRQFTVCADLTLTRAYGIPIQDLPLICRGLLERRAGSEAIRRFVLTEEDMWQQKAARLAAQDSKAWKARSRPHNAGDLGRAWRVTAPLTIQRHKQ